MSPSMARRDTVAKLSEMRSSIESSRNIIFLAMYMSPLGYSASLEAVPLRGVGECRLPTPATLAQVTVFLAKGGFWNLGVRTAP